MSESPIPRPVSEFAKVARAVCDGLERGLLGTPHEVELQLVRLHFCALRLPPVDAPQSQAKVRVPRASLDLSWLPDDVYWDVYDPFAMVPEEPAAKSLTDDLADMVTSLSEGLRLYETGRVQQAWWVWRDSFYGQWGDHLLGAQRALYFLGRR